MKERNPFLWKITQEDSSQVSYVFGTMHIAEGKDIGGLEFIKSKIETCDVFANEMDLGKHHLIDPETYHSDRPLFVELSAKKYQKLRNQILKSFEIDLNVIGTMKPLIITNMLAEVVLGKSGSVGLDRYLFEYAKSKGIETTGIEYVTEQAEIMSAIPMDYQLKALLDIGKNVSKFRRSILELNKLYQKGEIAKLHKKAKKSLGKMRKKLLYDRNTIMAERIFKMQAGSTCFVSIGAGHLFGSKGVLRKLKQMGLKVAIV